MVISGPAMYTFSASGAGLFYSVSFYTTLSTTLWAVLSIITMKAWGMLRLVRHVPIAEERPFGAVTLSVIVLIIVVVFAYMIISQILLLTIL